MDDDGDDRWTNFENHDKNSVLGKKAQEEKMPDLGDYLKIVLAQKSPRDRQERKYKVFFFSYSFLYIVEQSPFPGCPVR